MTSRTVPYCMNWEWCSTFTSYCRLWCISQGSKNKQLKVLYKRIESSSTWERNPSSFEEKLQQKHSEVLYVCHRSVREISQADSNAGCSSHLHFTRKQRGSVTLWVFTDSEIEVTNRESIPSWILSGVLSGMAALINGHEQLGREKKEKKKKRTVLQGPPVQPCVSRHDMLPTVEILARLHLLGVSLAMTEGALECESVYFTGNLI